MKKYLYIWLALMPLSLAAQSVNPLDYGLLEAKSGEERFYVLKRCHEDALKQGLSVSYEGINKIELVIPTEAKPIPLPDLTDFSGIRIIVENRQKNFVLFSMEKKAKQVNVDGKTIDAGDFRDINELAEGSKLLIIQDDNPWISKRLGYGPSSGRLRKDVLIIKKGESCNNTIMPYDNDYSEPKAWFVDVTNQKQIVIKNLYFERTHSSNYITKLLETRNVCNVFISNICITTPKGVINKGDGCMIIENCADVTINNVTIDNTYSDASNAGYGMRLVNVYDVKINRMNAHGEWGVFGNYNVNTVTLKDCDINRFDVHFYGKDIRSTNCTFRDMYNQFASVYGVISFKKCEFINEIPVLIESSFNAYTPFELKWQNCTFYLNKKKNYLLTLFGVPEPYNDRPELRRKCLPNIVMKNCKVYLDDDVDEWMVVKTHGVKYKDSFDYIQDVSIKGVQVISNDEKPFKVYSEELKTTQPIITKVKIKRKNK